MRVAEKFISINGEGQRAGELAVFLRFAGCNLRCSYCDTSWANDPDCPFVEESPGQLADYVSASGAANVTITGGEPLLQKREELLELFERLSGERENDRTDVAFFEGQKSTGGAVPIRVEVETNGAVDLAPFCDKYRPAFTMDYKLPGSGCEEQMCLSNFALLTAQDTVKFVCGSIADMERAGQVISAYRLTEKCPVYLSPVFGKIRPADMVEYMQKHKMNHVRLQLQLHKFIWDPDRRGV